MYFYLSFSATESRWFILKSHCSAVQAVRHLSQNMVPIWQILVDIIIRIFVVIQTNTIDTDTIGLEGNICFERKHWPSLHHINMRNTYDDTQNKVTFTNVLPGLFVIKKIIINIQSTRCLQMVLCMMFGPTIRDRTLTERVIKIK
jgi:hypothetical protein